MHAVYFEWGGKSADGTVGFALQRNVADFGTKPIHQLMVENGVSAYFHGHDYQYAYESHDDIIYQEVPSLCMSGSGLSGIYTEGDFGDDQTTEILPNTGHLRITVAPDHAAVEFVRSNITEVSYTYTVEPNSSALGTLGDVNGDDAVNSTDVLIALSCDVGLDTTPFCSMNCGDVNDDGVVNSTHALIILSYDASISVPFPVGGPGCPSSVIPGLGCTPCGGRSNIRKML
jgi:hypothetical protein